MGGLTGVLVAASFAGSGFLLVAPDYVGLGLSRIYHPYLYAATTANTAIDLLRAAQQVSAGLGISWQSTTLLVGFSQGAYSTAVVQRALERGPEPGITLRAAAALAPPLNLAEISVPFALQGRSTASSLYLAFIVASYAWIYGHPIATLFTDQYAPLAATLFDGTHEADEIRAKLPARPREMFRPGVVDALVAGRPSWFRDALAENEAYQWAPTAPLRLYYGDNDVDVSPQDPQRAAAEMRARGGNVTLVPVGPYDHTGVAFRGVPLVRVWFMELTAPAPRSERTQR
jgi:pimeloyl-ACP methyl ester carboxylesterase